MVLSLAEKLAKRLILAVNGVDIPKSNYYNNPLNSVKTSRCTIKMGHYEISAYTFKS